MSDKDELAEGKVLRDRPCDECGEYVAWDDTEPVICDECVDVQSLRDEIARQQDRIGELEAALAHAETELNSVWSGAENKVMSDERYRRYARQLAIQCIKKITPALSPRTEAENG